MKTSYPENDSHMRRVSAAQAKSFVAAGGRAYVLLPHGWMLVVNVDVIAFDSCTFAIRGETHNLDSGPYVAPSGSLTVGELKKLLEGVDDSKEVWSGIGNLSANATSVWNLGRDCILIGYEEQD